MLQDRCWPRTADESKLDHHASSAASGRDLAGGRSFPQGRLFQAGSLRTTHPDGAVEIYFHGLSSISSTWICERIRYRTSFLSVTDSHSVTQQIQSRLFVIGAR